MTTTLNTNTNTNANAPVAAAVDDYCDRGTTSTTTTTRLLEFTPRQNALRARYADRVAQEARRIQKSARRIALWKARIRKANKRLYPTANEEEGHCQIEFG